MRKIGKVGWLEPSEEMGWLVTRVEVGRGSRLGEQGRELGLLFKSNEELLEGSKQGKIVL